MKFRKLTVNSLPRVMINILARDNVSVVVFVEALNVCKEMKTWYATAKTSPIDVEIRHDDSSESQALRARHELSEFFRALLNLSKVTRSMFVKDFDRLLSELGRQDFWGTEGQCDPRGDRRELSGY